MKKMTRWGIGPKWAVISIVCAMPLCVANMVWKDVFAINRVPLGVLRIAGCLLLAIGVPFFASAVVALDRSFSRGKLFTRGVYGFCRHPIYASWIVFFVPASFLFIGSWVFLLIVITMYASLRFLLERVPMNFLRAVFLQNMGLRDS